MSDLGSDLRAGQAPGAGQEEGVGSVKALGRGCGPTSLSPALFPPFLPARSNMEAQPQSSAVYSHAYGNKPVSALIPGQGKPREG